MKTRISGLLILISLFVVSSCNKNEKEVQSLETISEKNQIILTEEQVKTAEIESGNLLRSLSTEVVYCNGMIDVPPDSKASIHVPVPGYVQHVYVLPGDKVIKGQRLVSLFHPDYISLQKQYTELVSQLKLAEKEFERQNILKNEDATTGRIFEKAEADLKTLRSQVGALEAQLTMLGMKPDEIFNGKIYNEVVLLAPFSGFVGSVNVNTGEYISQDKEIMTVLNNDHLHAELRVFEKDILKIKEKQPVLILLTGSNKTYEAQVKLVGKEVDPVSKTVQVHAHISKNYPEIVIGMFANAEILTSTDSVYVLPERAIMEEDGRFYCMVDLGQHIYEMQEVITGNTHDGYTEILNYEELINKKIVLKGAYSLFAMIKKSNED